MILIRKYMKIKNSKKMGKKNIHIVQILKILNFVIVVAHT